MRKTKFYSALMFLLLNAFTDSAHTLAPKCSFLLQTAPIDDKTINVLKSNPDFRQSMMRSGKSYSVIGAVVEQIAKTYRFQFLHAGRDVNFSNAALTLNIDGTRFNFQKPHAAKVSEVNATIIANSRSPDQPGAFQKLCAAKAVSV